MEENSPVEEEERKTPVQKPIMDPIPFSPVNI